MVTSVGNTVLHNAVKKQNTKKSKKRKGGVGGGWLIGDGGQSPEAE